MNVVISPNIKKVSERLDKNGNVIDPRTKQVIAPKEQAVYSAPAETPVPQAPSAPSVFFIPPTLSLKEIKQALKTLEDMKEKKVAELKAELEDL